MKRSVLTALALAKVHVYVLRPVPLMFRLLAPSVQLAGHVRLRLAPLNLTST